MRNLFLETIAEKNSSNKYKDFVKKNGKPTFLNEEMIIVGLQSFVPFINEACSRSSCVYDLSQIEALYSNRYDVSDDFKQNGDFDCHYCDETITFGGFYTSQELTDDVENLFHQIKAKKPSDSKAEATPGLKRSNKRKIDDNTGKKKPTIFIMKDDQSPDIPNLLMPLLQKKFNLKQSKVVVFDNSGLKDKLKTVSVPDFQTANLDAGWRFAEKVLGSLPIDYEMSTIKQMSIGQFMNQMPTFEDIQDTLALHQVPLSVQKMLLIYWRARYCQDKDKLLSLWLFEVIRRNGELPIIKSCEDIAENSKVIVDNADSTAISFVVKFDVHYIFMDYQKLNSKLIIYIFECEGNPAVDQRELARQKDVAQHYFVKINQDYFGGKLDLKSSDCESVKLKCSISFALTYFVLWKYYSVEQQALNNIDSLVKWLIMELQVIGKNEADSVDIRLSSIEEKEMSLQIKENSIDKQALPSIHLIPVESDSVSARQPSVKPQAIIRQSSSTRKLSPTAKLDRSIVKRDHVVKVITRKDSMVVANELDQSVAESKAKRMKAADADKTDGRLKKIGMDIKKFKPKAAPVFKLSKRNVIPDPAANVTTSTDEREPAAVNEVKNLLNFYFNHDKTRYKLLSSKCEAKYGSAFILQLSNKAGQVIQTSNGSRPQIDRSSSDSRFSRRPSGYIDKPHGVDQSKKVKHGHSSSMAVNYYMSKAFPSVDKQPTSANMTRTHSRSVQFKSADGSIRPTATNLDDTAALLKYRPGIEVRTSAFDRALQCLEQEQANRLLTEAKHAGRCIAMKTTFSKDLIRDTSKDIFVVDFKRALGHSAKLTSQGRSLFDCYQRVIVPISREAAGVMQYRVVVVENAGMSVTLFDPQGGDLNSNVNKQCCRSVCKFVAYEIESTTGRLIDKQQMTVSSLRPSVDTAPIESGNWSLYYAECMINHAKPQLHSTSKRDDTLARLSKRLASS